jgi:peptidoglycan L-alanyl-D-glutamate endopeptidase CwlK
MMQGSKAMASTGNFKFGKRSKDQLATVHPDLRKVAERAIQLSPYDFIVTEGKRTLAKQKEYVRKGASKTMKSRHLTGNALDYVGYFDGRVTYKYDIMVAISKAFKAAAKELSIPIVWGGDWKSFVDTPHVELDRSVYK